MRRVNFIYRCADVKAVFMMSKRGDILYMVISEHTHLLFENVCL